MDIQETLFWGVISGVITSFLLLIAGILFKKAVIPWFETLIYKGIDISGEWYCFPEGMNQEIKLEVQQRAGKLNGIATFVALNTEVPFSENFSTELYYEKIRSFKLIGDVRDRFIVLNLTTVNPNRLGVNSFVFEATGDGRKLQGAFSYFSVAKDKIGCNLISAFRDRSSAQKLSSKEFKNNFYGFDEVKFETELDYESFEVEFVDEEQLVKKKKKRTNKSL